LASSSPAIVADEMTSVHAAIEVSPSASWQMSPLLVAQRFADLFYVIGLRATPAKKLNSQPRLQQRASMPRSGGFSQLL
jgi:hypothetical protein